MYRQMVTLMEEKSRDHLPVHALRGILTPVVVKVVPVGEVLMTNKSGKQRQRVNPVRVVPWISPTTSKEQQQGPDAPQVEHIQERASSLSSPYPAAGAKGGREAVWGCSEHLLGYRTGVWCGMLENAMKPEKQEEITAITPTATALIPDLLFETQGLNKMKLPWSWVGAEPRMDAQDTANLFHEEGPRSQVGKVAAWPKQPCPQQSPVWDRH
ncbi:hypothetical protein QYF61_015779 [Mycteria americana]|uniref:Uncharacterized protein n=1 Tax=Mycteria americana TaxID=33587 RepID=A0AAN7P216_MYCAM|nr:hypothetical protein QYF61_015779 [Mycteria americana]